MSDRAFELSLTVLTLVMALLAVAGIALMVIRGVSPFPFIIIAVVLEIIGGGLLLYFWGKSYVAR